MESSRPVFRLLYLGTSLLAEAFALVHLMVCSRASLAAEVLFLRKQVAFYQERKVKPRRLDDSARLAMLFLAKLFDWKNALVNVKPDTFKAVLDNERRVLRHVVVFLNSDPAQVRCRVRQPVRHPSAL